MKTAYTLLGLTLCIALNTQAQNVGINTDGSTPDGDAILHIKNDASSSKDSSVVRIENEQNGANDVTGVEIYNSGTGATAKWDVYIPASGSTDLRIKNNGTDRITIQNDGDVGIGTTSPTAKLDVDGSAIFNESGAAVDFKIEGDTDTELFYVDGSANRIGIGTSSPDTKLEVNGGDLKVTDDAGAVYIADDGSIEIARAWAGGASSFIDFKNSIADDYDCRIMQDNSNGLKFLTGGNGATATAVTIDASQNVGIGTTSPASGLDIQNSLGYSVTTITGATTLNQTHNVVLCNTGPYTVTLPAAASNTGRVYYIKNIDSDGDDVTIDGNGSETIEGSETFKLGDYKDVVRIVSDGSNWFIIEKSVLFQCGTSTVSFTYNGSSVTYGTVLSSSGKCWMDRNLGASQVATSSTDYLAYGDLFQWGRAADGHQLITWTNSTTGSAVNGTTSTNADNPANALFITEGSAPNDWRVNQDGTLWNGESATNNPCPSGWRLPTNTEWNAELTSESITSAATAYSSVLKLTVAGYRNGSNGSLTSVGANGFYWSSTDNGSYTHDMRLSSTAGTHTNGRVFGFSVRCIKD